MADRPKAVPALDTLRAQRGEILHLMDRYGAYNVRVFGSVARDEATAESDIDLLVTFRDDVTLFDVAGLWVELQDLLGRQVDVVDDRSLKPHLRPSIRRDAVAL